jgi:ABC-type multidrug transport system fused ATPase/permease subunit
MQRWFESRLDPFPDAPPAQPPATLYAFCRHYTRGAERWLLLLTISTGLIALAEVALYAYVGALVDRMNAVGPGAFMAQEGPRLAWMAALVLVVLPSLVLLNSLVQHQTLLGNFPMRIRWNVHRYLLRQSMGYFQDEFAGRIATKLMQTSLAVRETVVKLLDIGNYVLVYFGGTLIVAASADWRLMLPFVGWLGCYALLMRWFVPRMGKVSQQQADARSDMTGRIVDSYTNIATVKLFSPFAARAGLTGSCGKCRRCSRTSARCTTASVRSRCRAWSMTPGAKELAVSKARSLRRHVRFHYGKQKGVIEHLSLHVAPGEKVGIVGRSGAGKSTLVNLLLRFYDVEGPHPDRRQDIARGDAGQHCARRSAW